LRDGPWIAFEALSGIAAGGCAGTGQFRFDSGGGGGDGAVEAFGALSLIVKQAGLGGQSGDRRFHAVRQIRRPLSRALQVGFAGIRQIIDGGDQGFDFLRIDMIEPFRRIAFQILEIRSQAGQRAKPEMHLKPGRTGQEQPEDNQKPGQFVAEFLDGRGDSPIIIGHLHQYVLVRAFRTNDAFENIKMLVERAVSLARLPVGCPGLRGLRQFLIP